MNFKFNGTLIVGIIFLLSVVVGVIFTNSRTVSPLINADGNAGRYVSDNQHDLSADRSQQPEPSTPASRDKSEYSAVPTAENAESNSFALRSSFIDGSLKELLERESLGDSEAAYELVARTIECLQSVPAYDCTYYLSSREEGISRLEYAAESGVVAAQINFLDDLSLLDSAAAPDLEGPVSTTRYSAYLKQALAKGSADAMYLLGLMELGSSSGGPRRDIDESKTGLSRLDAVSYLAASAEVYSAVTDMPHVSDNAKTELDRLDPREARIVQEKIANLLARKKCCFVLRRTANKEM